MVDCLTDLCGSGDQITVASCFHLSSDTFAHIEDELVEGSLAYLQFFLDLSTRSSCDKVLDDPSVAVAALIENDLKEGVFCLTSEDIRLDAEEISGQYDSASALIIHVINRSCWKLLLGELDLDQFLYRSPNSLLSHQILYWSTDVAVIDSLLALLYEELQQILDYIFTVFLSEVSSKSFVHGMNSYQEISSELDVVYE